MEQRDQAPDQILEHGQDYDGIKEYDNPLPQWFVLMFYATIAFSFLYLGYYGGKTYGIARASGAPQNLAYSGAVLAAQVREIEASREAFVEPSGRQALLAFLKAPASISRGEALFKANCVPCHGDQGQGIVGPNLTDNHWLHGGKPEDILRSIRGGWVEKGMPAWEPVLGAEKAHWLAAYVLSLRGKPVDNPKPPQGVEEREE
jgi:cytochrome c oxidase cbb3-type subunit 3